MYDFLALILFLAGLGVAAFGVLVGMTAVTELAANQEIGDPQRLLIGVMAVTGGAMLIGIAITVGAINDVRRTLRRIEKLGG